MIGAEMLTSYEPASTECDAIMTTYCNGPDGKGTAECACLADELTLEEKYCLPGNTSPNCQGQSLVSALPVTCFGRNCSAGGYRWARMLNQKCTITLCQQIVTLLGDDIVIQGGSQLWCGNKTLADATGITPSVTPADDPAAPTTAPFPQWLWLIIIMAIFLVIVVIPVAVIILRRFYESQNVSLV